MRKAAHIVFDLETLSQNVSKGIVLDCAASWFTFDKVESFLDIINDSSRIFYSKLDVQSQRDLGRVVCKDTVKWWSEQDRSVLIKTLPSKEDVTIDEFLEQFKTWIENIPNYDPKTAILYCRGQSFDIPLLQSLILDSVEFKDKYNIDERMWPCSFWNQRDIRSILCTLWGNPHIAKGILHKSEMEYFKKHNAVHDIAKDIISMQALWNADSVENLDEYISY